MQKKRFNVSPLGLSLVISYHIIHTVKITRGILWLLTGQAMASEVCEKKERMMERLVRRHKRMTMKLFEFGF